MEDNAQKISLKIYLRNFETTVSSPEEEQLTRRAASQLNEIITEYNSLYPDRDIIDKLIFIALQQSVKKLFLEKEIAKIDYEQSQMASQISEYLKDDIKR